LSVGLAARAGGSESYNRLALAVPKPRVTLTTTAGSSAIDREPATVQAAVDNFRTCTQAGFFNGTIFHRVVPGFVVQGGGFTGVAGGTLTAQTGLRAAIAQGDLERRADPALGSSLSSMLHNRAVARVKPPSPPC
jgi:hypothetical protein